MVPAEEHVPKAPYASASGIDCCFPKRQPRLPPPLAVSSCVWSITACPGPDQRRRLWVNAVAGKMDRRPRSMPYGASWGCSKQSREEPVLGLYLALDESLKRQTSKRSPIPRASLGPSTAPKSLC